MKTPYLCVLRLVYVKKEVLTKNSKLTQLKNGETNNKNLISHSQQNLLHQLYYKTAETAHKCTCHLYKTENTHTVQRMYNR